MVEAQLEADLEAPGKASTLPLCGNLGMLAVESWNILSESTLGKVIE